MKTYNLFIGIGTLITILIMSIPQLTGTAFVINKEKREPADWLSSYLLKKERLRKQESYNIPNNIKAIKITGNNQDFISYSEIKTIENNHTPAVHFYNHEAYNFSYSQDTLLIQARKDGNYGNLILEIPTQVNQLIFDNFRVGKLLPSKTIAFKLHVKNKSDVILENKLNSHIKNITIKGQSTLTLLNCFTPIIDVQIDNSMVYVQPNNHIDSLHAHLIGKSNIKKRTKSSTHENYNDKTLEELKTTSGVQQTKVNIYPIGNIKYYKADY